MSSNRYDMAHADRQSAYASLSEGSEVDFVFTPGQRAEGEAPLNARLMYVTAAHYGPDWNSIVHRHAFCEIFLIEAGAGRFFIAGDFLRVRAGDLVIINPMAEHAEYSQVTEPLAYTVIAVDGLQFLSGQSQREARPYVHIASVTPRFQRYVQLLLDEISTRAFGYDVICPDLMNILLVLILGQQRAGVSIAAYRPVSHKCAAAKAYLDAHFAEPVTLDDLSAAVHQSKYHLAHAFRSAYGVSPMRYLLERRLEESRHLLRETNYAINEIAAVTGFSSASLFSQAFKRAMCMTPNAYRRQTEPPAREA